MKIFTFYFISAKIQIYKYLVIILFMIANILNTNSFSQNTIKKDNRKIILIATLNNTYQNFIKDTLFQIDSCLKLRFDTISLSQLKKPEVVNGIKSNSDFVFNGIYCNKNQLFDINSKINVEKYYIKSFSITATYGPIWLTTPINKGACFDDYFKSLFRNYIHDFYYGKFSQKQKIWLTGISITTVDGKSFIINDIILELSK
jgi:hypothetical protein